MAGVPKIKSRNRPTRFVDLSDEQNDVKSENDTKVRAMSKIAQHPDFHKKVVMTYQQEAIDRRATLVFCANLVSVDAMVDTFKAAGIGAKSITSETEPQDRMEIMQEFKNGGFPVLVNCLVLTEGADMPTVH